MPILGPRLVVAGTSSGVGKTTVATGLMAALAARGVKVGAAKVGPDFIDPGYHALATGRPGRSLDPWLSGASTIPALAAKAGEGAEVLVVEGVMGLFDGAAERREPGAKPAESSTAHVAQLLDAPVVLVVDAAAMSASVAAVVHGFATFDPCLRVAGVVLNRVGSRGHEILLREALASLAIPVLGVLERDDDLVWRDRHLGLVPVVERTTEVRRALGALSEVVQRSCDVHSIVALAQTAPALATPAPLRARRQARARIGLAAGPAFSFYYPDNLELLEQAGAELVAFDPTEDRHLPPGLQGLYAGGGFPEVYAERLAANRALLADVRHQLAQGLVAWAECGGLLWLARSLDRHRLCGVIDADAHMTSRLVLGYRRAKLRTESPLAPAGTSLRGHEFHYSALEPPGDALQLESRFGTGTGGFASRRLLASYLHLHLAATPALAERFVATAATTPLPNVG